MLALSPFVARHLRDLERDGKKSLDIHTFYGLHRANGDLAQSGGACKRNIAIISVFGLGLA